MGLFYLSQTRGAGRSNPGDWLQNASLLGFHRTAILLMTKTIDGSGSPQYLVFQPLPDNLSNRQCDAYLQNIFAADLRSAFTLITNLQKQITELLQQSGLLARPGDTPLPSGERHQSKCSGDCRKKKQFGVLVSGSSTATRSRDVPDNPVSGHFWL